jgi:hypothetical protein
VAGCANLDAVRAFGTTAANLSAYPDAAYAYRDSATTLEPFLDEGVALQPAQQRGVRDAQIQALLQSQAAVAAYFSTLARLAGADTFGMVAEIDRIRLRLRALGPLLAPIPGSTDYLQLANDAAAITETLAKFSELAAQERSIRQVVGAAGPQVMREVQLMRDVGGDWRRQVEGDRSIIVDKLDLLALARDAPKLLKYLARDRSAALKHQYDSTLAKFDAADGALARIQAGHAALAQNLTRLSGPEVKELLQSAVADMREAQGNLAAVH